jgi:hypothetical protein
LQAPKEFKAPPELPEQPALVFPAQQELPEQPALQAHKELKEQPEQPEPSEFRELKVPQAQPVLQVRKAFKE